MAGLPGGGVVVAGKVWTGAGSPPFTPTVTVWSADGSRRWTASLPGWSSATAVVGTPGGGVVAGRVESADVAEIVSYLGDGTPNPGFGVGGIAQIPVPSYPVVGGYTPYATVSALALDGDGRIVVALVSGQCDNRVRACRYSDGAVHLTRLLPDGAVDPDFHGGTPLSIGVNSTPVFDLRSKLVTWADGSIGVATGVGPDAVTKVLPDGSGLDRAFGDGGAAFVQPGAEAGCGVGDDVGVLDLRPDGTLLATFEHGPTGSPAPGPDCDWVAVQLTADGVLDPTFAGDGRLELPQWYLDPYTRSSSDGDGGFSVIVPRGSADPSLGNTGEGLRVLVRSYAPDGHVRSDHQLPAYFELSSHSVVGATLQLLDSVVDGSGNRYVHSEGGDSPYRGLIALG